MPNVVCTINKYKYKRIDKHTNYKQQPSIRKPGTSYIPARRASATVAALGGGRGRDALDAVAQLSERQRAHLEPHLKLVSEVG